MKTAAIIAVAGLASAAAAQSATVSLTHDGGATVNIGDTVTWTLSVAFTGAVAATGVNMSIQGDNTLGSSSSMTYTATNGGNNDGASNGAGIGFVSLTNSLFLEAFGGGAALRDNPLVIGTFSFTAASAGTLTYGVSKGQATSAFVSVGLSAFADVEFATTGDVAGINVQSLNIVPTPASAALLGLGGLVATRRRR